MSRISAFVTPESAPFACTGLERARVGAGDGSALPSPADTSMSAPKLAITGGVRFANVPRTSAFIIPLKVSLYVQDWSVHGVGMSSNLRAAVCLEVIAMGGAALALAGRAGGT